MAEGQVASEVQMKRLQIPDVDMETPYPMDQPRMGYALIINNVESEIPGSRIDVEAFVETFKTLGFDVRCEANCSREEMVDIKKWITEEKNHEDANCFVLVVNSHGDQHGYLMDRHNNRAWRIEDFVFELSVVKSLLGKPKLMILQSCRGDNWNTGREVPRRTLSRLAVPDDLEQPAFLPDKSDMFLSFATVPGYIAYGGDESGSYFLQTIATYLARHFMTEDLCTIQKRVNYFMSELKMGEEGIMHCPEARTTFRRKLEFSEFHKKDTNAVDSKSTTSPPNASPREITGMSQQTASSYGKTSAQAASQETASTYPQGATAPSHTKPPQATTLQSLGSPRSKTWSPASLSLVISSVQETSLSENRATPPTQVTPSTEETRSDEVESPPPHDIYDVVKPREPGRTAKVKLTPQQKTTFKLVNLQLLHTHNTWLQFWSGTRFAVMSSDQVLLWGKSAAKGSGVFHIYRLTDTGWKKQREVPRLCKHVDVQLQPVTVNNKELLAVSCGECQKLRLYDTESEEEVTAFHSLTHLPQQICQGEVGSMYVVHAVEGAKPVLELNAGTVPFTGPNKTIQSGMDALYSMHYVLNPHRLLVFSSPSSGVVSAMSVETEKNVWEIKGEVDGSPCHPHGVLFSSTHGLLFVADGDNCRLLLLHPQDGSHLKTIQFHEDIGCVVNMYIHRNQLVMCHIVENKVKAVHKKGTLLSRQWVIP